MREFPVVSFTMNHNIIASKKLKCLYFTMDMSPLIDDYAHRDVVTKSKIEDKRTFEEYLSCAVPMVVSHVNC